MVLRRLASLMGHISRKRNIKGFWQPIPTPAEIPDAHHLKRQVRYIALNPCRKELCRDPLEWYWSTHRELFGATTDSFPGIVHLPKALNDKQPQFLVRFHGYVSGDPSVSLSGTPVPMPDTLQKYPYKSLDEILAASAAALRVLPISVRKKNSPLRPLFLHLAHQHGWKKQTALLAELCAMSLSGVKYLLSQPAPKGMGAAHLCLSDERLRPKRVTELFSGN